MTQHRHKAGRLSARRWATLASVLAVALAAPTPAQADTLREALVAAYMNNPTLTGARAEQRADRRRRADCPG